jgi:hypothetical protein
MNQNNNNTKTNNGLDASKRRRKLRRKAKENKTQKRMVLLQAIMCAAFLVALVLFVIKALKSNERGIKLPPNMLKKRQMAKQMRPDLDNPPMADVKGNGPFKNLRNRFWSISQYRHSDYMRDLGDRSPAYANLRKEYDALLPSGDEESLERMKLAVQSLRKRKYENLMAHDMPYDVHNCPDDPPPNYPYAWNIKDVLDNWGTDDMIPKEAIYQGICVFDYETEKEKALKYGELELPFVVRDDPKVLRTVERWSQQGYMQKLLGKHTRYRTEYSPNNHFMYWNKPKRKAVENHIIEKDWKPPTEMSRMSFSNWLEHANVTDDKLGSDNEHWYFRLIGCGEMGKSCDKDSSEYLFDELSFFQPTEDNPLYMVDPKKQKGIHCRFGMKGVTAVNHFDGSRNSIALLGGERRYFLSHPDQCENLNLFPRGHPSARHSAVDWSNPDWEKFPSFADAEVNEVVLQAGDVLYLPTDWFHHIISLELNFQCNTRSGTTDHYLGAIKQCGF